MTTEYCKARLTALALPIPVSRDGQDHQRLVILKIKIRSSKKCDLEGQKTDHPNIVILKIKIVILKIKITFKIIVLLGLKERYW